MKRWLVTTGCVAILAAGFGGFWSGGSAASDYDDDTKAQMAKIAEIEGQIESLQKHAADVKAAQLKSVDVAPLGQKVATLQDNYLAAASSNYGDDRSIVANSEQLAKLFAADSVERGKTPWYGASKYTREVHWQFDSTTSINGANANVVWTLRDKDGNIYGYARAVASMVDGSFSGLKVDLTNAANQLADTSDEKGGEMKADPLAHIKEAIENAG